MGKPAALITKLAGEATFRCALFRPLSGSARWPHGSARPVPRSEGVFPPTAASLQPMRSRTVVGGDGSTGAILSAETTCLPNAFWVIGMYRIADFRGVEKQRCGRGLEAWCCADRTNQVQEIEACAAASDGNCAIRRYVLARCGQEVIDDNSPFFANGRGTRLTYCAVRGAFEYLRDMLGWKKGNGDMPRPRIHDLRHTFACRRLLCWYRQGKDVHNLIAALSTYMGHGKVTDTYWYLTGTPELLAIAGGRFERFARDEKGGRA